jgi:hypothetical protein
MPRQRKEMHFFDWYCERGEAWYRQFFPPPDAAVAYRAIGKATPRLFGNPRGARADPRAAIKLPHGRDPAQRSRPGLLLVPP